jgi:hypothetical protein
MLQNGAYTAEKLDNFFMESGSLPSRRQGPVDMSGCNRTAARNDPKPCIFEEAAALVTIFRFAKLTLTNPDGQDPRYCGWWFNNLGGTGTGQGKS